MVSRRTNKGQIIDLDKLLAQQGGRPAVGNTGTDGEGNVRDSKGNIIEKSEDRVRAYYRDNPRSSTSAKSLKGPMPEVSSEDTGIQPEVKTAKTQKENVRTKKVQPDPTPEPEAPQGESFDDQEPIGFKEVELPNGDIEMVPYYTQEDAPDGKDKPNKG